MIVVSGVERQAVTDLAHRTLQENPRGEATEYPVYPEKLWDPYRSRRYDLGEQLYALLKLIVPRGR